MARPACRTAPACRRQRRLDKEHAAAVLNGLADQGLRLAIEDFGSGHFALAQLKRFPVRTIKLAPGFVSGLPTQKHDVAIVRALLSMARSLGVRVVAEGVETGEQSRLLRLLHCDEMQGFLFSKPVPIGEFETLIQRNEHS